MLNKPKLLYFGKKNVVFKDRVADNKKLSEKISFRAFKFISALRGLIRPCGETLAYTCSAARG